MYLIKLDTYIAWTLLYTKGHSMIPDLIFKFRIIFRFFKKLQRSKDFLIFFYYNKMDLQNVSLIIIYDLKSIFDKISSRKHASL